MTSPRNSPAAHRGLFDALECKTLVTTDPSPPAAVTILEAVKPRLLTIPSVEELLQTQYPEFPFETTFEESRWDSFLVMYVSTQTILTL